MLPARASPASLTSSSRLESPGAALAFGSEYGPPLPARRRQPARARPLSFAVPSVSTALRSRLASAWAPRATAPGAGSFSGAAAALRPLPPDVRPGGGVVSSGGRGRNARAVPGGGCDPPRPAATRRPPSSSPPAGSDPCPSPRLGVAVCATAPGGGAGEALRHCLGGTRLTRSFRSVPQGRPRAARLGLGMGRRSSPRCSHWNQRGQAPRGEYPREGCRGNRGSFLG